MHTTSYTQISNNVYICSRNSRHTGFGYIYQREWFLFSICALGIVEPPVSFASCGIPCSFFVIGQYLLNCTAFQNSITLRSPSLRNKVTTTLRTSNFSAWGLTSTFRSDTTPVPGSINSLQLRRQNQNWNFSWPFCPSMLLAPSSQRSNSYFRLLWRTRVPVGSKKRT